MKKLTHGICLTAQIIVLVIGLFIFDIFHFLFYPVDIEDDVYGNFPNEFKAAKKEAGEDELVIATGSLYLIGEILQHLNDDTSPSAEGRIESQVEAFIHKQKTVPHNNASTNLGSSLHIMFSGYVRRVS